MAEPESTIRVMIADDHEIVIRGLEVSLASFSDIEIVACVSTGQEAITKSIELLPDVLLLDLVMPDIDGLDVIKNIRQRVSNIAIIALTNFKEANLVHGALKEGAIAYLLKNAKLDELATAIRNAAHGKITLAPEAAAILIQTMQHPNNENFGLTERELEILHHLATGLSNGEIAQKLNISASTVKNHVSSIIAKLEVSSRTEAATKALKLGLIRH